MWGNLAGRLGAKDINATLKKLGDVVAPPSTEGDEYYSDEEEDEEAEGDDEGYYSDEEVKGGRIGGGFGFVGLLTRALDDRGTEYNDDDNDDDNENDIDNEEALYEGQDDDDEYEDEYEVDFEISGPVINDKGDPGSLSLPLSDIQESQFQPKSDSKSKLSDTIETKQGLFYDYSLDPDQADFITSQEQDKTQKQKEIQTQNENQQYKPILMSTKNPSYNDDYQDQDQYDYENKHKYNKALEIEVQMKAETENETETEMNVRTVAEDPKIPPVESHAVQNQDKSVAAILMDTLTSQSEESTTGSSTSDPDASNKCNGNLSLDPLPTEKIVNQQSQAQIHDQTPIQEHSEKPSPYNHQITSDQIVQIQQEESSIQLPKHSSKNVSTYDIQTSNNGEEQERVQTQQERYTSTSSSFPITEPSDEQNKEKESCAKQDVQSEPTEKSWQELLVRKSKSNSTDNNEGSQPTKHIGAQDSQSLQKSEMDVLFADKEKTETIQEIQTAKKVAGEDSFHASDNKNTSEQRDQQRQSKPQFSPQEPDSFITAIDDNTTPMDKSFDTVDTARKGETQPSNDSSKDEKCEIIQSNISENTITITEEFLHLQEKLKIAESQIFKLQQQRTAEKEEANSMIERMMFEFQKKEARLLEATTEESQHEVMRVQEKFQNEIHNLEEQLAKQRKEFIKKEEQYRQIVDRSENRIESLETEIRNLSRNFEGKIIQAEQREHRSVRMAEEKVAQKMAMLDERDEQINQLKEMIKRLESSMNEHVEGAEEAEEEVMELQTENEHLQEQVGRLEAECAKLKSVVARLESDAEQVGELQMEMTLLREDRDRLRAQNQSVAESAFSSRAKLESERDAALAEVRDLKQQLTATLADLELAQADRARIITANQNLEAALEAFQNERQAELDLLEEQRLDAEEAIKSAYSASLDAVRQTHEAEMKQVQHAADSAIKTMMNEMKVLEANLQKQKTENSQTRRSLDEAIHRLQTNQEDVIDRTLMKNILLDWCTMKDKDKRHQVLELMARVLHFTEQEREKVHLTHLDIETVRSRVVGALAAPLPPANADKIEGNNVQEKWISFLLSETDDAS